MLIYHDDTKRYIELYVTKSQVRLELQDLNPEFEYEISYVVKDLDALCHALGCQQEELSQKLIQMLKGEYRAATIFSEFLQANNIEASAYSGMR